MPSATANSVMLSSARSSLTVRTRPTSEADPDRRTVNGTRPARRRPSPGDLEDRSAHLQQVPPVEPHRVRDALGIHPRPVGRAEILDPQLPFPAEEPGVDVGGVRILHTHATTSRSADRQVVGQLEDLTARRFGFYDLEPEAPGPAPALIR